MRTRSRRPEVNGLRFLKQRARPRSNNAFIALKESFMYQCLLVPVDGSDTSRQGLREAVQLAAGRGARLVLLHVVDDYPFLGEVASLQSYDDLMQSLRSRGDALLREAAATARSAGIEAHPLLRQAGSRRIADVIVDEALKNGCDLVVMGTHGRRGFTRWALGSEAEGVARECGVPVLLVRDHAPNALHQAAEAV
jgi:nucleotide-binding universal stress UspA family protein